MRVVAFGETTDKTMVPTKTGPARVIPYEDANMITLTAVSADGDWVVTGR